jgi:hypothetical protein
MEAYLTFPFWYWRAGGEVFLGEKWRFFLTGIDGVWYCFVSILDTQPHHEDTSMKLHLLVGENKNFIGWTFVAYGGSVNAVLGPKEYEIMSQMTLLKLHSLTSFV